MQLQVVVTIKFGEQKKIHKLILQEFQYGKDVFQTTTTDMNALNIPLIEGDGSLRFIL